MTSQFSPIVSKILALSREEAARLASTSVGPEHLLLGMLRLGKSPVTDVFTRLRIDIPTIKSELERQVMDNDINRPIDTKEPVLNEKANNILKLAVLEARIQHTQRVDEAHLLLAILHDRVNNGAKNVLYDNGIIYEDVKTLLQSQDNASTAPATNSGLSADNFDDMLDDLEPQKGNQQQNSQYRTHTQAVQSKTPVLDNFSTDLTKAALDGKLDRVVGRKKEINRVMEILGRRKKNNPILIGEPGVGKSAIVEGLADIIAKRISPVMTGKKLVSLNMTAIVAGTKYRGQFEERILALIKELEANPDIIVFIDEIHTIIGAGSTPGTMDAANILKPALARGTIQCIGATTIDEYRKNIEKDGALERRFQKITVEPTTKEDTLIILNNIKDRYEQHHHVSYTPEAIAACVSLTDRYITDRNFPDKAIDALDEAGSKVHFSTAAVPPEIEEKEKKLEAVKEKKQNAVRNQNFELAAAFRDKQTHLEAEITMLRRDWSISENSRRQEVTEDNVAEVVSVMAGVPVSRIAENEGIRLKGMAEKLKNAVIAQDKAIEMTVKAIQRNRVGLNSPNHPIGAFMFLGPTGVGKTYLAKKLAEFMFGSSDALIRIDMSEYSEQFNASRMIGAPPGYVGYDEGGQLTEKVRTHPYSIVLLDEIEKAHSSIYNLLLQVLDEGRLTDGNGRNIDFRNTVIIMTSNTGTRQLKEFSRGVGFNAGRGGMALNEKDKEYARSVIQKALSKQFAPEFLNRLDEIITFDQLDLDAVKKIVNLETNALCKRIEPLGYTLTLSENAKELIATKGYDVQFGARPLKRAIQKYIEDVLCEKIINEELKPGDSVYVDKDETTAKLTFRTDRGMPAHEE
ncbi:ATP-dependent Clp protease ATP-binding subunit [Xylanibacter muris]|uniref:ATP-dependent Clp protease ATP-binding subunit n=1 Tax=Xylanibacter muris TaxID=2736290 RepID=A0ABX2AMC6_9BACT|nr:ATP-dependent Clp protease ATP-binding subunit [Xylanibacter muris]NPD92343.1 ATP-dependent Clp protease ATP-binding subunit [Xylanibacter muris]